PISGGLAQMLYGGGGGGGGGGTATGGGGGGLPEGALANLSNIGVGTEGDSYGGYGFGLGQPGGGIFGRGGGTNISPRISLGGGGGGGGKGLDLLSGDSWHGGQWFGKSITEGKIADVAGSPAARGLELAGGSMLATSGLLGVNRGTGMGVAEGALGGAAMGLSLGGPLGAAIGGGIGLGVGLGEMLAGVQSPRNQAKTEVQRTYHITISNQTADQIVQTANSKYGGNVGVAVRSPEVRQMIGIYAAGTGQGSKFPMSADTPFGASLTEAGGKLYQSPTYEYGSPYTYKSSLPVYGGNPGGSLPS